MEKNHLAKVFPELKKEFSSISKLQDEIDKINTFLEPMDKTKERSRSFKLVKTITLNVKDYYGYKRKNETVHLSVKSIELLLGRLKDQLEGMVEEKTIGLLNKMTTLTSSMPRTSSGGKREV